MGPFNCINTNEHRKLCEDIAQDRDGAANDLKKWKIVLEAASYYAGTLEKNSSEFSSMGKYTQSTKYRHYSSSKFIKEFSVFTKSN